MSLSDNQISKLTQEVLEIRAGLSEMSEVVRAQAKQIKQAGSKIDRIFDRVADVKQFPNEVTRDEFVELLNAIKDINKIARRISRKSEAE